ncbi:MAG TPA: hypothetical protein VFT91_07845 [Dehalococcoidia bacterium]|nr:hypothetical protein [Dehalococcoidia bacterium]
MAGYMRAFLVSLLIAAGGVLLLATAACGGGGGGGQPSGGSPTAEPKKEKGATITVNSTKDADARDGELTLREALLLASGELDKGALEGDERGRVNGKPGAERADLVVFDQSVFSGEDAPPIAVESALPPLRGGDDTIDGKGLVTIAGPNKTLTCLTLASNGNEVRGLRIQGCQTAVAVGKDKVGNRIGEPGKGNVLSGNQVGIEVRGQRTVIVANILGLDAKGESALPNEFEGIWVTSDARDTVIGGTEAGEGNVISGNDLHGVNVDGTEGTVIQGNIIGLDAAGKTEMRNNFGIIVQLGARGTLIGGDADGARNVISGNRTGILVQHLGTEGTTIKGNFIGTDVSGEQGVRNGVDVLITADKTTNVVGENHTLGPLLGP